MWGIDIKEKGYKIALYQYTSKPIGNIEHRAGEIENGQTDLFG